MWSVMVVYYMAKDRKVGFLQWTFFISLMGSILSTGVLLQKNQGLMFGPMPAWMKLKFVLYFIFLVIGVVALKKLINEKLILMFLILALATTIYISVTKPYF